MVSTFITKITTVTTHVLHGEPKFALSERHGSLTRECQLHMCTGLDRAQTKTSSIQRIVINARLPIPGHRAMRTRKRDEPRWWWQDQTWHQVFHEVIVKSHAIQQEFHHRSFAQSGKIWNYEAITPTWITQKVHRWTTATNLCSKTGVTRTHNTDLLNLDENKFVY